MEKTKEQVQQEVVATFNAAIQQVRDAQLGRYVVAITSDATPLRETGDGTIALFGSKIFSTDRRANANQVRDGINAQFAAKGTDTRVEVEQSATWRQRRIDAVLGFIAFVTNEKAQA